MEVNDSFGQRFNISSVRVLLRWLQRNTWFDQLQYHTTDCHMVAMSMQFIFQKPTFQTRGLEQQNIISQSISSLAACLLALSSY